MAPKVGTKQLSNRAAVVEFVEPNPKKRGSQSSTRYDAYKRAKTVGEALDAGALMGDLKYDLTKGYLRLVDQVGGGPADVRVAAAASGAAGVARPLRSASAPALSGPRDVAGQQPAQVVAGTVRQRYAERREPTPPTPVAANDGSASTRRRKMREPMPVAPELARPTCGPSSSADREAVATADGAAARAAAVVMPARGLADLSMHGGLLDRMKARGTLSATNGRPSLAPAPLGGAAFRPRGSVALEVRRPLPQRDLCPSATTAVQGLCNAGEASMSSGDAVAASAGCGANESDPIGRLPDLPVLEQESALSEWPASELAREASIEDDEKLARQLQEDPEGDEEYARQVQKELEEDLQGDEALARQLHEEEMRVKESKQVTSAETFPRKDEASLTEASAASSSVMETKRERSSCAEEEASQDHERCIKMQRVTSGEMTPPVGAASSPAVDAAGGSSSLTRLPQPLSQPVRMAALLTEPPNFLMQPTGSSSSSSAARPSCNSGGFGNGTQCVAEADEPRFASTPASSREEAPDTSFLQATSPESLLQAWGTEMDGSGVVDTIPIQSVAEPIIGLPSAESHDGKNLAVAKAESSPLLPSGQNELGLEKCFRDGDELACPGPDISGLAGREASDIPGDDASAPTALGAEELEAAEEPWFGENEACELEIGLESHDNAEDPFCETEAGELEKGADSPDRAGEDHCGEPEVGELETGADSPDRAGEGTCGEPEVGELETGLECPERGEEDHCGEPEVGALGTGMECHERGEEDHCGEPEVGALGTGLECPKRGEGDHYGEPEACELETGLESSNRAGEHHSGEPEIGELKTGRDGYQIGLAETGTEQGETGTGRDGHRTGLESSERAGEHQCGEPETDELETGPETITLCLRLGITVVKQEPLDEEPPAASEADPAMAPAIEPAPREESGAAHAGPRQLDLRQMLQNQAQGDRALGEGDAIALSREEEEQRRRREQQEQQEQTEQLEAAQLASYELNAAEKRDREARDRALVEGGDVEPLMDRAQGLFEACPRLFELLEGLEGRKLLWRYVLIQDLARKWYREKAQSYFLQQRELLGVLLERQKMVLDKDGAPHLVLDKDGALQHIHETADKVEAAIYAMPEEGQGGLWGAYIPEIFAPRSIAEGREDAIELD